MKKLIAALLIACMSLTLLAGCGAKAPEATQAEKPTAAAEKKEAKTEEKPAEKIKVTYLRPGTEVEHNAELVQAINDKLDADGTGLELEIEYIPSDVFQDKVNMMLSTGEEFDLLCVMEDQKPFTGSTLL